MARRPNYAFERNQRARAKAAKREAKREQRAEARAARRAGESPAGEADEQTEVVGESREPDHAGNR